MPRWIALALLCLSVVIVDRASSATLGMRHSDEEVLRAIESTYWIPLSEPKKRKVYVIAAPWCPICRGLSNRLAATPSDIEFRFVIAAPKSANERARVGRALIEKSPEALKRLYFDKRSPGRPPAPGEAFADGYNDPIWTAYAPELQRIAGSTIGLPTLVYLKAGRLHVQSGDPADIAALARDVDETEQKPETSPFQSLLNAPPQIKEVKAAIRYAKKNSVAVFAAPHAKAPRLATLLAGTGFMQKGIVEVDGERWLAFQFTNGAAPSAFGRPGDFR